MADHTYDPSKIILTWGPILFTGFGEGTFVEVERNADSFKLTVGTDGETARSASADKSGLVKATLLQTAAVNGLLSAQLLFDETTKLGKLPLMVADAFGTTLHSCPLAYLLKPAKTTFGKEVEGREWTIVCPNLASFVGGSIIP